MDTFTDLELAALHSIFTETPELTADLEWQLERATVTSRRNSGAGFFTDIKVPADAPPLTTPGTLGHATSAHIHGLEHGLGFILFIDAGKLDLLEGYTYGPESTASLDLFNLEFKLYNVPVERFDQTSATH